MLNQSAFDLERSDAVSGTLNHVVSTRYKPEVPLLIATRPVACKIPISAESQLVFLRVAPIFAEQAERPIWSYSYRDFTFLAHGDFLQIIIQQADRETGRRFSHRTRTDFVS